jgi:hypothetical protein
MQGRSRYLAHSPPASVLSIEAGEVAYRPGRMFDVDAGVEHGYGHSAAGEPAAHAADLDPRWA